MEDLHITILEQAVQIDVLTDENERLRTALQKLNELRLSTRDMLVASINRLGAENERLREACEAVLDSRIDLGIAINKCRAALQPEEGTK